MQKFALVPDDDLAEALQRIILAGAPRLSRESNCFLATVSAGHVANGLALAGFVVMRRDDNTLRLDV
jgi:hypothetical protein